MATSKEYAYYIKGSKLAIVQKDWTFSGGQTISQPGLNDLGSAGALFWKSPKETIADGLEIQYAYSPTYFIESTDLSTTTASGWDQDNDGNFRLRAAGGTDWTSSPNLSSVEYIVLRNAGRFNGLHKVSLVQSTRIVTTTKVSASTSNTDFEETVTLYYDVNVLNDESDELDIPRYLATAVVHYVKAKYAEDAGEIDMKEYFMREFRRTTEKHQSGRKMGPYMIQGFGLMR